MEQDYIKYGLNPLDPLQPALQPIKVDENETDAEYLAAANKYNADLAKFVTGHKKLTKLWARMKNEESAFSDAMQACVAHNNAHPFPRRRFAKTGLKRWDDSYYDAVLTTPEELQTELDKLHAAVELAEKHIREFFAYESEMQRLLDAATALPHTLHDTYALLYGDFTLTAQGNLAYSKRSAEWMIERRSAQDAAVELRKAMEDAWKSLED